MPWDTDSTGEADISSYAGDHDVTTLSRCHVADRKRELLSCEQITILLKLVCPLAESMLVARRSSAFTCRRNICRAISTNPESPSSSTPQFLREHTQQHESHPESAPTSYSGRLFVRPWDGISSLPDAYAIIRGIERRYGKIKSFRMLRVREQLHFLQPNLIL
jgi:hypothetical protein